MGGTGLQQSLVASIEGTNYLLDFVHKPCCNTGVAGLDIFDLRDCLDDDCSIKTLHLTRFPENKRRKS